MSETHEVEWVQPQTPAEFEVVTTYEKGHEPEQKSVDYATVELANTAATDALKLEGVTSVAVYDRATGKAVSGSGGTKQAAPAAAPQASAAARSTQPPKP